jgi:hypothetical protein
MPVSESLCIIQRRFKWYSLATFDSMNSDLDAVIKWANILFTICGRELESLTLGKRHAGDVVIAYILDVVGHLAMVAVLRGTVPTRHNLAVMKHLEEVGGIPWMRRIDRVLKPDLSPWVDRHVAGSHRIVVRAKGRASLVKGIIRLVWTEFWEFANVKLRDNAHIDASKLNHLGIYLM